MASLQHLALPALLLLRGSGAATRRGQSRDRHFARVFASTVVNAADADQCVSVAPRGYVLCTWLCGIHCVPRRGATALSGMQLGTWACMASVAAARAAACALLAISSSSPQLYTPASPMRGMRMRACSMLCSIGCDAVHDYVLGCCKRRASDIMLSLNAGLRLTKAVPGAMPIVRR